MQLTELSVLILCGVVRLGAGFSYTSSPLEKSTTTAAAGPVARVTACGVCDMRRCPPVNNCPGKLAKDDCNCCFTCYEADAATKAKNACNNVQCPRNKICLLNIQNIPVCRCPTNFHCRNKRDKGLCGRDGITYKSRCHLKIAECSTGKKIRAAHKGPCVKGPNHGHRNIKPNRLGHHGHKLRMDKQKRTRAEKRRRRQRNTRLLH